MDTQLNHTKPTYSGSVTSRPLVSPTSATSILILAHLNLTLTAGVQFFPFFPFSGESMRQASGEFAEDPCSSVKRGNMVRAARALLSAVTHLLVLADMSDVYKLLLQLKLVSLMNTQCELGLLNIWFSSRLTSLCRISFYLFCFTTFLFWILKCLLGHFVGGG